MRSAIAALLLAPCAAGAQPCSLPGPGAMLLESARYSAAVRTEPAKIAVGKHFSVEVAICPKSGVLPPDSVRVDAHMPEHRHGMNYAAKVAPLPGGGYKAEGLMFHMPGRWELLLDVRSGTGTDRLTQSIVLE